MSVSKDTGSPAAGSPGASSPEYVEQLPQKRKGGRKPVYATQEERKQRNRAAQAAFRERRTEYMKKLEATIKQNEETLSNLSNTARLAQETVLMLRYKNSLLERILLEKGIDVKSELESCGHPYDTAVSAPPACTMASDTIHGHTAPLLGNGSLYKPQTSQAQDNTLTFKMSPLLHSAALSHSSSPSASSAVPTPPDHSVSFSPRNGMSVADFTSPPSSGFVLPSYPAFRSHLEELEQEDYPPELLSPGSAHSGGPPQKLARLGPGPTGRSSLGSVAPVGHHGHHPHHQRQQSGQGLPYNFNYPFNFNTSGLR